jgi:heme/copper-type cytochrome/quinol oxidase subunit 3
VSRIRRVLDVSGLPNVTFGQKSLMWWGTVGFMTIEGWTLAIIVVSYIYLRQSTAEWPPLRTPVPSLVVPTINLLLFVVSIVPTYITAKAAKRLDAGAVKRWLLISCVVIIPTVVLRWFELWALRTRWDTNAYGTAAWTIVGFHATLLLLDVIDTIGLTLFWWLKPMPLKSFSDTADNSFYWYFTVGIWIPVYLIVYVGPRFL